MKNERKSRWKRNPIPAETLKKLSDANISELERVELAEKCRKQLSYCYMDMLRITGLSNRKYSRCLKVLKSNNRDLCNRIIRGECSLNAAVEEVNNPGYLQNLRTYRFVDRLNASGTEIIFQIRNFALYRDQGKLLLAAAVRGKKPKEKLYLLDDFQPVVRAAISVMGMVSCGIYRMNANLIITKPDGTTRGHLAHHIVSQFYSLRLDSVSVGRD